MEKEPNIKEITKRLNGYSENLRENNQLGNSRLILALSEMISVMAWSSRKQEESTKKMIRLTNTIIVLTVILVIGLIVQILIAFSQYQLTEELGIEDRILQGQFRIRAEEFCKENPDSEESGLYFENGKAAPCSTVLNQKNNLFEKLKFWKQ